MYWQKSCVCYRNWKSSLHGSRRLILIKLLKIIGCKPTELSIYKGRLKSKKQSAQPVFLADPLTPTATPSSARLVWAVRVLGKVAEIWRMPSPQPSSTGEGVGCSRFYGYRRFEKQLGFTTVDFRSSEKEKSSLHNLFSSQNP